MNSSKKTAAAAIVIAICTEEERATTKVNTEWVKPCLQRRQSRGFYDQLVSELQIKDEDIYKNYLRMKPEHFDEILDIIRNDISKQNTHLRDSISAEVKIAVMIRFLATGASFQELSTCFRVHRSTIGEFIPEVCAAIYVGFNKPFHIF